NFTLDGVESIVVGKYAYFQPGFESVGISLILLYGCCGTSLSGDAQRFVRWALAASTVTDRFHTLCPRLEPGELREGALRRWQRAEKPHGMIGSGVGERRPLPEEKWATVAKL